MQSYSKEFTVKFSKPNISSNPIAKVYGIYYDISLLPHQDLKV